MPQDQIPDRHNLHKNTYGQQNPVEKGMRNYPGQADAKLSKCECGNQSQIASSRPVSTEARSMRDFAENRFSQYFFAWRIWLRPVSLGCLQAGRLVALASAVIRIILSMQTFAFSLCSARKY